MYFICTHDYYDNNSKKPKRMCQNSKMLNQKMFMEEKNFSSSAYTKTPGILQELKPSLCFKTARDILSDELDALFFK